MTNKMFLIGRSFCKGDHFWTVFLSIDFRISDFDRRLLPENGSNIGNFLKFLTNCWPNLDKFIYFRNNPTFCSFD